MLSYRAIEKENWFSFFNLLSNMAQGRQILLELVDREVGDQIEEDWTLFRGVHYDVSNDTLFVSTALLEHPIAFPKFIMTQEDGLLKAIGIRDAEGRLQIIHFRDPLMIEGHSH